MLEGNVTNLLIYMVFPISSLVKDLSLLLSKFSGCTQVSKQFEQLLPFPIMVLPNPSLISSSLPNKVTLSSPYEEIDAQILSSAPTQVMKSPAPQVSFRPVPSMFQDQ